MLGGTLSFKVGFIIKVTHWGGIPGSQHLRLIPEIE